MEMKGYEGIYDITKYGVITNVKTGKERKLLKDKHGYYFLVLSNMGYNKNCLLHRLLAINFIPNYENKPCVNHKNGIRDDNRIENLEWCTYSENIIHSYEVLGRVGAMKNKTGKDCHNSIKLYQYTKCKEFIREWDCAYDVYRELKIHQQNIGKVCLGKRKIAGGFFWSYDKII